MSVTARLAILAPDATEIELETVSLPAPRPWEVVIEQRAFGICHSQLDLIDRAGRTTPLVIGHESTGVVIAIGSEVTHFDVDDEVMLTWLPRLPDADRVPTASRIPLPDGRVASTHNVFAWGTHAIADEQYVVKAPSGIAPDLSCIIGCAVMTGSGSVLNGVGDVARRSVAVWGVGGVGLASVGAAHVLGANPIIAIDISTEKLEVAKAMGATHVIDARSEDSVAVIRDLTGGAGVDFSFDCSGVGPNVERSLAAVRSGVPGRDAGGTLVLVGAPRVPFAFNGMDLLATSKAMVGVFGGLCIPERDFPVFAKWATAGQLDLGTLVTARYTLDELNAGVADLRNGKVLGRAVVVL